MESLMFRSMFTFYTVTMIFVVKVFGFSVVCNITKLQISEENQDLVIVRWDCDKSANEFQVTFQQIHFGTPVNTGSYTYTSGWDFRSFSTYSVNQFCANSSYLVTVTPRKFYQDEYLYGDTNASRKYERQEGLSVNFNRPASNTLQFTWKEFPTYCANDNHVEYEYQLLLSNGDIIKDGVTNETDVTFSNLCHCSYEFRVTFKADNSTGPRSLPYDVLYPSTVPVPQIVENVTVVSVSPYKSLLHWHASTVGCPPTKYIVEYRLENQDMCLPISGNTRIKVSNVTSTSPTLSNMIPHSTYMIYVTGINSAGNSITHASTWTTAEAEPSGPPQNVMLTSIGSTQFSLSWEAPLCRERHGYINMYTYVLTNAHSGETRTDNTTGRDITFRGLLQSTDYSVSISAWTSVGLGPPAVLLFATGKVIIYTTLTSPTDPFATKTFAPNTDTSATLTVSDAVGSNTIVIAISVAGICLIVIAWIVTVLIYRFYKFEPTGGQESDDIPGTDNVELLKIMAEQNDDPVPADNVVYESNTEALENSTEVVNINKTDTYETEQQHRSVMVDIYGHISNQGNKDANQQEQEQAQNNETCIGQ